MRMDSATRAGMCSKEVADDATEYARGVLWACQRPELAQPFLNHA
jgi:hypothetical protein